MYTIIGGVQSRAFRAVWMLEEIGEPYDHSAVKPRDPLVMAHNPSGKIPVLLADGTAISDSTAIITYLADKHQKLTYPAGTIERARQDAITHMLLDELDAVLWTAARHTFILPKEKRMPEVKDSLRWEFANNTARLADLIDGPYLAGDKMTITDIVATHCLNWAYGAKFPVESRALLDYSKTVRSRDAFQRTAALAK